MIALTYLLLQYGLTLLLLAIWMLVLLALLSRMKSWGARGVLGIVGLAGVALVLFYHHARHSLIWQEEIALTDGGSMWVERKVQLGRGGDASQMGSLQGIDGGSLTLVHPVTGEKIAWQVPVGLFPEVLDIDGDAAYLVGHPFPPTLWGCPSPNYVVFAYRQGAWQRVEFEAMPKRIIKKNILGTVGQQEQGYIVEHGHRVDSKFVTNRYASQGEANLVLDKRYTNPASDSSGCWTSEIYRDANGRQAERRPIEDAYGKDAVERMRRHWEANKRVYLSDEEAIELGITKITSLNRRTQDE